jgi:5-methylthioadenosine/S-adenosylhomocysteine deaminase
LYRAAARFAVQEDLPIAVHVAESRAERELVVSGEGDFAPGLRARGIAVAPRGRSSIELLGRLGILDARPLLIHCVDVDAQDISTISEAGCAVAHCPVANAKLGHGLAPIPRLRRAGVRIGIGTDSVGSNNRLDLLEEARIASLLQRAAENCFDLLPAGELLRICTIEGAMALGLDDRIGTLEPGKQADLCAVAIDRPHTVPSLDPVDTLFHAARGSDVVLTVVAGAVLYAWGEHRTVDARSARIAIEAAAERLHGAL